MSQINSRVKKIEKRLSVDDELDKPVKISFVDSLTGEPVVWNTTRRRIIQVFDNIRQTPDRLPCMEKNFPPVWPYGRN